jgi:ABC-type glycerol-3-phosphate transport system substrate-binding protein
MWVEDGWSGSDIYEGIKNDCVFLTWMHQLDFLFILGSKGLGIEGCLSGKEDLGIAIMPQGVSFELDKDGLPKRIGSREAHTFGWFWGIPKSAPEPQLAYDLAMFITSYKPQLQETKNFFLIPIRKDVDDVLKKEIKTSWKNIVYTGSREQLRRNDENYLPRFKTLTDYQEYLHEYYNAFEEVVIKGRYSPQGPQGRVDRNFIREY